MANKQTRRLYKKQVSVKFNKGVNCTGADNDDRPELRFVSFPFGKQPSKKKGKRGLTIPKLVKEIRESIESDTI